MSRVTRMAAMAALSDLDDYCRMGVSVNPKGPYGVLKRFIAQQDAGVVQVCPTKDRECGPNPAGWCEECPKQSGASLLCKANAPLPEGCYCKPGECSAPVIMGRQTPCRDPQKAKQTGAIHDNQ